MKRLLAVLLAGVALTACGGDYGSPVDGSVGANYLCADHGGVKSVGTSRYGYVTAAVCGDGTAVSVEVCRFHDGHLGTCK